MSQSRFFSSQSNQASISFRRDSVAELTSADNVKVMSEIIIAPGDEFDGGYY